MKKKFIVLAIITVALIVIVLSLPTTISYEETNIEKQPVEIPLSYTVIDAKYYGGLEGLNYVMYEEVNIKNTDIEPGTFIINCFFKTLKRGTFTDETRVYIIPGKNQIGKCKADTNFGEDVVSTYSISPSTRTEYMDVQVTKTKTREVRMYQKLLGLY